MSYIVDDPELDKKFKDEFEFREKYKRVVKENLLACYKEQLGDMELECYKMKVKIVKLEAELEEE